MSGGAATAHAQFEAPVALDPNVARQGTTLLVTAGESLLSANGEAARSITFALPRGMRIDPSSREQLCTQRDARRAACPAPSRIGFGRFALALRGYTLGRGETELGWVIDAHLGEPLRRGDAGSVVLIARLLGADLVTTLLAPALGGTVPGASVTVGRLRRTGGRYGVELAFPKLPVQFDVPAPLTATPARLELALGAMRRVRENFTRRLRVRTLDGYEIRRLKDHRLVGHSLLRNPRECRGAWTSEVRIGFGDGVRRSATRVPCVRATG